MARAAFAAVTLALALIFFFLGQSIQNGGRIILSQSIYMLSALFGSLFVISILPGQKADDHH